MKYKWFGQRVKKLTFKRKLSRVKRGYAKHIPGLFSGINSFSVEVIDIDLLPTLKI